MTSGRGFITSLSKTGAGQWNLGNSNNTYTGSTTIADGILGINDGEGAFLGSNSSSTVAFFTVTERPDNLGILRGDESARRRLRRNSPVLSAVTEAHRRHRDGVRRGVPRPVTRGSGGFDRGPSGRPGRHGSIALSEADIAGDFSLGTAAGAAAAGVAYARQGSVTSGQTLPFSVPPSASFSRSRDLPQRYIARSMARRRSLSAGILPARGWRAGGRGRGGPLAPSRVNDNTNTGRIMPP